MLCREVAVEAGSVGGEEDLVAVVHRVVVVRHVVAAVGLAVAAGNSSVLARCAACSRRAEIKLDVCEWAEHNAYISTKALPAQC